MDAKWYLTPHLRLNGLNAVIIWRSIARRGMSAEPRHQDEEYRVKNVDFALLPVLPQPRFSMLDILAIVNCLFNLCVLMRFRP